MITVEATTEIGPEKTLTIELPADVQPGRHRVVVTLDENPLPPSIQRSKHLKLRQLHIPGWSTASAFSRTDIYGENGR